MQVQKPSQVSLTVATLRYDERQYRWASLSYVPTSDSLYMRRPLLVPVHHPSLQSWGELCSLHFWRFFWASQRQHKFQTKNTWLPFFQETRSRDFLTITGTLSLAEAVHGCELPLQDSESLRRLSHNVKPLLAKGLPVRIPDAKRRMTVYEYKNKKTAILYTLSWQ